MSQHLLDAIVLGNSVRAYLLAGGFVVACVIVLQVYALIVARRLRVMAARTETLWDDLVLDLLNRAATPMLMVAGFYFLCETLRTPSGLVTFSRLLLVVLGSYYLVTSALKIIDHLGRRAIAARNGNGTANHEAVHHMQVLARVVAWIVGALLVLTNMGYDVSSLLTGLGIAGIAVGLAVQNILGDLFSYFCILVDKPFVLGDVVRSGTDTGTIESIGIRSTRIRTGTGEELIVPNANLTSSRIHNYRRLTERRVGFVIGVTYDTPLEKLEKIPRLIEEALAAVPLLSLERAHFRSFGASSLEFETVYIVKSADYREFMDAQERMNLGILERLRRSGIALAFPTQTVIFDRTSRAQGETEWDAIRARLEERGERPVGGGRSMAAG